MKKNGINLLEESSIIMEVSQIPTLFQGQLINKRLMKLNYKQPNDLQNYDYFYPKDIKV